MATLSTLFACYSLLPPSFTFSACPLLVQSTLVEYYSQLQSPQTTPQNLPRWTLDVPWPLQHADLDPKRRDDPFRRPHAVTL
ncbi:hypothetical protein HDK64DRAFT_264912 [Phyllosticta capitalensis]